MLCYVVLYCVVLLYSVPRGVVCWHGIKWCVVLGRVGLSVWRVVAWCSARCCGVVCWCVVCCVVVWCVWLRCVMLYVVMILCVVVC